MQWQRFLFISMGVWFVREWKREQADTWWGRILSQWQRAHRHTNFFVPISAPDGRNLVFTFSFKYLPLNPVFSFAAVFPKLLIFTRSLFFTRRFPKFSLRLPPLKKGLIEIVFKIDGDTGRDRNPPPPTLHLWEKANCEFFFQCHFHGASLFLEADSPLSSLLCWIQFQDYLDTEIHN